MGWWLIATAAGVAFGVIVAMTDSLSALGIAAVSVAAVLLITGPVRLLVLTGLTGVLVGPTWMPVVASIGPVDIRISDVLVASAIVVALMRAKPTPDRWVLALTALLIAYGLVRSGLNPNGATFLRVVEPLLLGVVLRWTLPPGYDLWRDVRLYGVVAVVSAPWLTLQETNRWAGLPGGPNELSLVAAVLVILAAPMPRGWHRRATIAVGALGLWQGRSITALIAVVLGLFVISGYRPGGTLTRRALSPATLIVAVPLIVLLIPVMRPDARQTIVAHIAQAQVFDAAYSSTNPIVGSGWASLTDREILFADTNVIGLHNVYLDWLTQLGVLGLLLLLGWFFSAVRTSDRVGAAVLIVVAIWMNTTGAFPGCPWGLLGVAIAARPAPGGSLDIRRVTPKRMAPRTLRVGRTMPSGAS